MIRPHAYGRYSALVPLTTPDDLAFLYDLALDPRVGLHCRLQGSTPSYQEFAARAWDGVLAQWLIVSRRTGRRVGAAVLASPDFRNGHAFFSVLGAPASWGRVLLIDATAAAISYAFETWPFRQIYADVDDVSYLRIASGVGRYFDVDGCRREHAYIEGRYRDVYLLSITRSRWQERWIPAFARLRRPVLTDGA